MSYKLLRNCQTIKKCCKIDNCAICPTGPFGQDGIKGETGQSGTAQGYTGPIGPIGPTGIQGNPGPTGIQGSTGTTGIQGNPGTTGIQGNPGTTGIQGNAGEQGYTGPIGPIGPTGLQGNPGPTGIQGNPGETGIQGNTGATGIQGNPGEIGIQGNTGENGIRGNPGEGVTGPTGPIGPTGIQGIGSTGPTGQQGPIGDTGPSVNPTIEIVSGTDPISSTISTTLLSGTTHTLASGSTIGFEKTIIKTSDNVFSPVFAVNNGVVGGSQINYLKYDPTLNRMYVGGSWTTIAGVASANIAYYDFTSGTWNGMSDGANNLVFDILIDGTRVYVAGRFTQVGGPVDANGIAYWDTGTNTWNAIQNLNGANFFSGAQATVYKMLVYNGYLYAEGNFDNVDGVSFTVGIARWSITGLVWTPLANGLSSQTAVATMALNGTDIWVGGAFVSVYNSSPTAVPYTRRLAKYDTLTNTWSGYNNTVNGTQVTGIVFISPNNLFIQSNAISISTNVGTTLDIAYSFVLDISTLSITKYGYSGSTSLYPFIDTDGVLWVLGGTNVGPPISYIIGSGLISSSTYGPYFYDTTANKWGYFIGTTSSNIVSMEKTNVAGEYWIGMGGTSNGQYFDGGNLTNVGPLLKLNKNNIVKVTCPTLILNGQTERTRFHLTWKGQSVKIINTNNTNWAVSNSSMVNSLGAQNGVGQVFFY